MPPLQQTIFDSASPIPFDNSPYSSVFDTDLFAPHSQIPHPPKHDTPYAPSSPPASSEPTSEDIAALFGVAPLPTPSLIPKATPLTVAPPAHYSSLPHHLAQEKSPIAPIPSSPTFYEPPQKPTPSSLNKTHRYPSYNAYQEQYSEPQQQYIEQHTQYQYNNYNNNNNNNNTTNNAPETYNYNVNGYSVYNTDNYSQPESRLESTKSDPLMLSPSKPSIFSRFSNTGGAGFGTTPNLAKAVSYMSSTLAVTSTFATEKLTTASTKIADLWQHNQTLPQQHSQQPSDQDHYNNYYGATINSGPYYHDGKNSQPSYETGYGPVSNNGSNYVLSDSNNYTTNYSPTFGDTKQPPPYEYQPYQQPQQQQQQQHQHQQPTSGSFAETATSTLSNAATVATSYLPNLSKLPALKALPLPAMPALPWKSRNKGLPQQQPSQYQYQGSETYSFGQPEQQEQQQQPQFAQDACQPFNNYSYSYSEQIGQGGGRLLAGTGELLQKGRQMVQTGAQAGVAWWWGDSKNPMSNVV
ncbi:hypothetical protein BGZ59_010038 [Podila verticillata]|nr:hypothetical protein BGZ59_010038 [Podila verticillata]